MSRHIFDIDQMIVARSEFIREARKLPPGAERNQKRQVARSLMRLIQTQSAARASDVNAGSRRRFKQRAPLDQRLNEQAERLRREALGTPPGVARDNLLRLARQAEEAAQMQVWLATSGARAPD